MHASKRDQCVASYHRLVKSSPNSNYKLLSTSLTSGSQLYLTASELQWWVTTAVGFLW